MKFSIYPYEAILSAATHEALSQSVRSAAGSAGFTSFHYGAHAPFKADGTKARFLFDGMEQKTVHVLSDYPGSWFERYQSENYIEIDPLVQHCSRSILPMVWHMQTASDHPKASKMFSEAAQHGLMSGATFSVLGTHQEIGLMSLTMDSDREKHKRHVVKHLGIGYMLLVHIHEAMRRLQFPRDRGAGPVQLTQRESETLAWVNAGKPSWEIGHIMNISERTVNFHITNACRKLDCGTRRHAAVKALTLGLIRP